MTEQEAFKIGFLMRCADERLSPEATRARIKAAASLAKSANGLLDAAKDIGWKGLLTAAIAPPAIGLGAGYGLASIHDDNYDIDEARKEEELAEYYRAIDRMSRANRLQTAT